MRSWNFLSLLVFLFSLGASFAEASPASLSYQGKITKTDGTDLEYNNVSFIFKVTDAAGTCIIYQEQVSGYDMTNSKGVFDVPIGSGSVTYPSDGSLTILDSFNNSRTFTCSGGSTYAAASGDTRKLRVMFFDGVGWQTLSPDLTVRSVPYSAFAYSAEKLGTYNSTDFLLKAIMPVTSCPAGNFLTYNGTNIVCSPVSTTSGTVTTVTSANSYLTVTNGTTTPALTLNVGTTANTVAAGNDSRITGALQGGSAAGGDLSGTYPNPTVAKIQGVAVSSTAPTSGQVLTFNGTIWAPATASGGGGGSGTITDVVAGTGMSGGGSAGSVTLDLANTTVSAGTYSRANITVDAQGRLTAAANGSAVNLASEVTGTLPIANGGTGQTTKTAAYNALSPLTTKGDLVVSDGTNNVRLAAGTDGQYLSADSSQAGGLKWVTPSTGTVSNVSGTSPIVVANGSSTPTISVNTATTSALGVVQVGSGIAVSSGTISADPANFPSLVPISKGGTGQSTQTAAFNALSPLTTKGDFLVSNGTNNIRLPAGTDGQTLIADSTQAAGVKWSTPTSGTVTSVTGTSPITVTNGTSTPAISVNTATTSALGVVQVGSGIAVSSGTISADPANFPSAVPVSKGGTGSTSLTANSLLMSNGTGTGLTALSCSTGQIVGFNASGIAGCYSANTIGYFANGGNAFGAAASLGTTDSNSLTVLTNNTARMTVTSGGAVGIATTAPDYTLHVKSAGNTDDGVKIESSGTAGPELSLKSTDTGGHEFLLLSTGSGNGPGAGFFGIYDKSIPSYRMVINSSGQMGINTTSPGYTLDMGNNSDGVRMPAGTTGQQPTSNAGVMRFNKDTTAMEYSDGSAWIPMKDKYNSTTITATSTTLAASDGYQTLNFATTTNGTITLPSTTGLPVGWWIIVTNNSNSRSLTLNTPDSTTFDGGATSITFGRGAYLNPPTYKLTWKGTTWRPSYVSGGAFYAPPGASMYIYSTSTTGSAGSLGMAVGTSYEGDGGSISLSSGSGASQSATTRAGGGISLAAGFGVNNGAGGNISILAGQSNNGGTGTGASGTVSISGGGSSNGIGTVFLNPNGGSVAVGMATTPVATLDVNGAIKSVAVSNTSTTIDFSTGNLQYTSSSCGTINLNNMKSGASYTLAVQGTAGGTCAFNAYSDAGSTALTVKAGTVSLVQTAGKHTLFSFLVMGSYVYIAAIDGY